MPKLDRAEEHLKCFDRQELDWMNSNPYRAVRNGEMDGGYEIVRVDILRPPCDSLAPVIGDCIQNLRSVLDHLAFQLAIQHQGRRLTDDEARSVSFPITDCIRFKNFQAFMKGAPGKGIKLLCQGAQAEIHRLQPCNRRNPKRDILWILNTLNNIDTHRRPLLGGSAAWMASRGSLSFIGPPYDDFSIQDITLTLGLLKQNAEMARIKWAGEPPGPEVDMTPDFMVVVAFGEKRPLRGLHVLWFLRTAHRTIRDDVLPRFGRFF